MGNLHSVRLAFNRHKKVLKNVKNPSDIKDCDALILPGVGSFDPAMKHLNQANLIRCLQDWAASNKPMLGICLGLQLLFESSEEGTSKGLGLLKGHIHKLPEEKEERIPHMGWSPLNLKKPCPLLKIKDQTNWMYFVHSYSAILEDTDNLAATTNFGKSEVSAIVWEGRLGACQFHPEKSAEAGHQMIGRWLNWLERGAYLIT